ncbi:MAG: hypothetical protein N2109_07215 [Fimbriimonadales bacterium]|nr:hypothetical protein [Fimbriimonadales bacterium]
MIAIALLAALAESSAPDWGVLARNDLASRLRLRPEEVRMVESQSVTWPDGSLGLARLGEMATMALVPGASLVLEAKGRRFRYHAGGNAVKLAGPVALDRFSLLYLEPNESDPNGNGSLVRSSVLGYGAQTVLSGVTAFEPGPGPAVLAVRRTSRSGQQLWLWTPQGGQPRRLHAAFSYGPLAVDGKAGRWAAVFRATAGGAFRVAWGEVGGDRPRETDPPVGQPVDRLAFEAGVLAARTGTKWRSLGQAGWEPSADREAYDERGRWLLNRSFRLEARSMAASDGGRRTVVAKVHFSGMEASRAELPGLEFDRFEPLADGWVLVCGREGEASAAYLVHADLGWVIPSCKARGPIRAFDMPAATQGGLPARSLDSEGGERVQ